MLKRITNAPLAGEEIKFKKVSYFSLFLNYAIAFMAVLAVIVLYLLLTL